MEVWALRLRGYPCVERAASGVVGGSESCVLPHKIRTEWRKSVNGLDWHAHAQGTAWSNRDHCETNGLRPVFETLTLHWVWTPPHQQDICDKGIILGITSPPTARACVTQIQAQKVVSWGSSFTRNSQNEGNREADKLKTSSFCSTSHIDLSHRHVTVNTYLCDMFFKPVSQASASMLIA